MNSSSSHVHGKDFGISNTGFSCHGVSIFFFFLALLLLSFGSLIFARCELTLSWGKVFPWRFGWGN